MLVELKIGRKPTQDILIDDKLAEDHHAILEIGDGNHVWIRDLQSRYGTLVNNNPIMHSPLHHGDLLQIGFTRIDWEKYIPEIIELPGVPDGLPAAQVLPVEEPEEQQSSRTAQVLQVEEPEELQKSTTTQVLEEEKPKSAFQEEEIQSAVNNEEKSSSFEKEVVETTDVRAPYIPVTQAPHFRLNQVMESIFINPFTLLALILVTMLLGGWLIALAIH